MESNFEFLSDHSLMSYHLRSIRLMSTYSSDSNASDDYYNAIAKSMNLNDDDLTHVDSHGNAQMVDVGGKTPTLRKATAEAKVYLGQKVFEKVASNSMKKGDVLTVAKLGGIMGAKHTSILIPLCHPLSLSHIDVSLHLEEDYYGIRIESTVSTEGNTGVEMEALTAASVSALVVYDMCKAISHDIIISEIRLIAKSGGKRDFSR